MSRTLLQSTLSFGLLFIAAGCGGDNPSAPDASQRFSVRYSVDGSFAGCSVFYITRQDGVAPDQENQGGTSTADSVSVPWTHDFDITVTPLHPFVTQVGAVCSAQTVGTVDVSVTVDGQQVASDSDTGQVASAQAGMELTVSP